MARRNRIPHGKLVKAGNIKSGMTIYHDCMWRSVWRVTQYDGFVRIVFASGIGAMARTFGKYEPAQLVPVRITIRAARRKQGVA